MIIRPSPKPWIAEIHAYVPGKSTTSDGRPLVKLSANENPLGTSPAAVEALQASRQDAASYPDPDARKLREKSLRFMASTLIESFVAPGLGNCCIARFRL